MIHDSHLPKGNRHNKPKMIVVHCMGEYILDPEPEHAVQFLDKLGLSAHILVDPAGDIFRCRSDREGAYHARNYNTNSLGIEFLVEGEHNYGSFLEMIKTPYITTAQWEAGVEVVSDWVKLYDIEEDQIVRHSDISPGRKVDPGEGFHWQDFLDRVMT